MKINIVEINENNRVTLISIQHNDVEYLFSIKELFNSILADDELFKTFKYSVDLDDKGMPSINLDRLNEMCISQAQQKILLNLSQLNLNYETYLDSYRTLKDFSMFPLYTNLTPISNETVSEFYKERNFVLNQQQQNTDNQQPSEPQYQPYTQQLLEQVYNSVRQKMSDEYINKYLSEKGIESLTSMLEDMKNGEMNNDNLFTVDLNLPISPQDRLKLISDICDKLILEARRILDEINALEEQQEVSNEMAQQDNQMASVDFDGNTPPSQPQAEQPMDTHTHTSSQPEPEQPEPEQTNDDSIPNSICALNDISSTSSPLVQDTEQTNKINSVIDNLKTHFNITPQIEELIIKHIINITGGLK